MALNIRTFGIRTLSAVVFAVLLLGCLMWNYISFTFFFFVVAMLGLDEFYRMAEKMEARPFKLIGFISAILLYFAFINTDYLVHGSEMFANLKQVIAFLPFIILIVALFNKREKPVPDVLYTLFGIVYSVLPFALLHEMVFAPDLAHDVHAFYPKILLGVILLIWSNDTFAYIGGSLFGKHKMMEQVSPGKTWEGTIFGVLVTFGISFLIRKFLFDSDFELFSLLGILVPIVATIGDLVESMLKRQAGIKDTGNIMPGHGGILDRFDSLIFVSPFVFVIAKLL